MYGVRCSNRNCAFAHPDSAEEASLDTHQATTTEPKPLALVFPKSEALIRREIEDPKANFESTAASIKHGTVRVPADVWVEGWRRNPGQFLQYVNPFQRLLAVNSTSPKGVIDLHYQTVEEVGDVLNAALHGSVEGFDWEYYDEDSASVWIVTGVGSHTEQKGRTLIYDAVYDYLERFGYAFKIAKDNHGNAGGFFISL
jgi:hypothetical protein